MIVRNKFLEQDFETNLKDFKYHKKFDSKYIEGILVEEQDKKIKDMFIGCCKEFNKKCPNRNIFIAENDSVIWIVLPMRNVNRKDVCMILNKSNKKI